MRNLFIIYTLFLIILKSTTALASNDYCFFESSASPNEVVKLCSKFLDSKPPIHLTVRALNRRGLAYQALNDLQRSLADFDKLIGMNSRVAGYYDNRQSVLRALGRLTDALRDADKAVTLAPNSAYVYHSRGTVLLEMGRYDQAVADFTKSFSIQSRNVFSLYDRGRAHHFAKRFGLATEDFTQVINIDPNFVDALRERSVARISLGELEAAANDIRQYLILRPDDFAAQKIAEHIASHKTAATTTTQPNIKAHQGRRRAALVIGNSAYRYTPELRNPRNDAHDIGEALKQRGFKILVGIDLDKQGMERILKSFAELLGDSDDGIFYYAGHGVQIDGINYLIPIDANISSAAALDFELIKVETVQRLMEENPNRSSILVLDACRNNPLVRNLLSTAKTRNWELREGLAQFNASVGTLISFSTQPGNVAQDGDGRNSPFTEAFVAQLQTVMDREDIYDVLINVRNRVMKRTDGRQVPWEHSALKSRFYF